MWKLVKYLNFTTDIFSNNADKTYEQNTESINTTVKGDTMERYKLSSLALTVC